MTTLLLGFAKSNWRILLAVVAVALMIAAIWLYGQAQYTHGWKDREHEQQMLELETFRSEANRLSGLSSKLEREVDALREAQPKIIERLTRVEVQNPLPDHCVIPVDGLRELNQLIRQTNATAELK